MNEGRKDDDGKLRWSIMPYEQLEIILKVLEFGANKYGIDNWKEVYGAKPRYLNAAMRHLVARMKGHINDEESGLPHLAHCICCLLFLLWFDDNEKTPT